MNCSRPGFPLLHYLLEFAQTHNRWVDDAIQPSHLLCNPSPLALSLSQHQGLFQWVGIFTSGGQSRKWQPTPVFLPGKSHGQSSLVGSSRLGHKESDITEQLSTQMIYRKHSILVFIIILSLKIDITVIPWYLQIGGGVCAIALLGDDSKTLLNHIFPSSFLVSLRRNLHCFTFLCQLKI